MYQYTQQLQITALQASMECKAMGALLLSINGEEEFNFIHDEVLRGRTLSAFIGGSDAEQGETCSHFNIGIFCSENQGKS